MELKFNYPGNVKSMVFTIVWIYLVYYVTLPDGMIKLGFIDNYPGLKEIGHVIMLMIGIVLIGPTFVTWLDKATTRQVAAFGGMLFGRKR
jgi:hypothetical protein